MGELEKGVETMRASIDEMVRKGWNVWRPYLNALLADSLTRLGRKQEALEFINSGLDQISRTGERGQEPEVHRIKGEILLSAPEPHLASGEASLRKAIAISQKQKAKLYELRAMVSLARTLKSHGREKEVRRSLKKCYGWFTEGFETADLKEAKGLLNEWR